MNAVIPLQHQSFPVRKISKLGYASLLIALGFPFLLLVLFAIDFVLEDFAVEVLKGQTSNKFMDFFVPFGAVGGTIIHFGGLLVGIVSAFQKEHKRLFPVLGVFLNGMLMLLALCIMVLILFTWAASKSHWYVK